MPTKSAAKSSKVISDIEKEALRDTIRERKAQSRRRSGNGEAPGGRRDPDGQYPTARFLHSFTRRSPGAW